MEVAVGWAGSPAHAVRLTLLYSAWITKFTKGKAIPIPIDDNRDEAATR